MRNPKRIRPILRELAVIWKKYPDLRLGQLIGNVAEGTALYYADDDDLIAQLKAFYLGEKLEGRDDLR